MNKESNNKLLVQSAMLAKPAGRLKKVCLLLLVLAIVVPLSCSKYKERSLYITAKGGLNARLEPSINGKRAIIIPEGSKVQAIAEQGEPMTISGKSGKWTQVVYNKNKYWVFGGFLSASITFTIPMVRAQAANVYGIPVSEVTVIKVADNLYKTSYLGMDMSGLGKTPKNYLWAVVSGECKEVMSLDFVSYQLAHINNDNLMDLALSGGCCGNMVVNILLRNNDGSFSSVLEKNAQVAAHGSVAIQSLGKCAKTSVLVAPGNTPGAGKPERFQFNCATNKMDLVK